MFLASKLFLVAVYAKIEDKDAIKAGDNNSFFYHVQKNPAHEIDWEKVSYFDKKRNTDRRMIKEAIYIWAFDKRNLINLKNTRPSNPVWMEIYTTHSKNYQTIAIERLYLRFHFLVICPFILYMYILFKR